MRARPRSRNFPLAFPSRTCDAPAMSIRKRLEFHAPFRGMPAGFSLSDVEIRLARPQERPLWDSLMDERRHLGFQRLAARGLRYVASFGGPVAGPGGVAERRLQVRSARQVVRLEAGAAVPAAGDGGEQHAFPDPVRAGRVPEPRLLLPCGDDPPARRRLAGGARAPGAPGGDVLRPGQVFRHHVQGGGLGVPGPDEGVRPRQRSLHQTPTAGRRRSS